jgi:predicted dehydrogenase
MNPLVVGMIGVGGFGGYRRERMRETGLFQIAAVCDRNQEALAKAASEEGALPYTDFEAMLGHPGLEAVVITTGADSHAKLSIAAMHRGLHVFLEKPLCTSVAEIAALRQAARETGKVVGLGHKHCASEPWLLLAKRYIEEGLLGTVVCFEDNSSHSGGLEIQAGDWRGLASSNPGGMLFQCGVHELHALAFLFGAPVSVQAMMRYNANPNTETADAANVHLRYSGGLVGTLNCYHVTPYIHEFRIFGTKGALYFDTHLKKGWFQERKRNEVESRVPLDIPETSPDHDRANLVSWFEGIRSNTPVYPGLEDGIQAVLPVFAAEISDKERREINVS